MIIVELNTMGKKVLCFLISFSYCCLCAAQQVIPSGGYALKSEISVNWILGGSLSAIPLNNPHTLNKLQKEQLTESEISFKVYPNPATDFIIVEMTPVDTGRLILELYNNLGSQILKKVILSQAIYLVKIGNIPSGDYFLKISLPSEDKLFQVKKIIKK